jgi:hypothetical protein
VQYARYGGQEPHLGWSPLKRSRRLMCKSKALVACGGIVARAFLCLLLHTQEYRRSDERAFRDSGRRSPDTDAPARSYPASVPPFWKDRTDDRWGVPPDQP